MGVGFDYGVPTGSVCGVSSTRKVIKVIDTIATTESVTYTIARGDLQKAIARVEKANKRAAKNNLAGYQCSYADGEPMPVYDEVFDAQIGGFVRRSLAPLYYIDTVDFTITGMVPRIGDWEVVAMLEDDEHAGTVSRSFPGAAEVDLTPVLTGSMECDHCHTTRSRVKTFVLRDQNGSLIKVGRNCLSLYTGIMVGGNFDVTPMKLSDEMDEIVRHAIGSSDVCARVDELITLAVGAVEIHGWMSTTAANELGKTATADRVRAAYGRSAASHELRDELTGAADPARVTAILDYLNAMTYDGSDYVRNLLACVKAPSGLVSWSNFGIVVSAVATYDRFVERQAREAITVESQWVGTPGAKETFENVEVISIRQMAGQWSNPDLVKMVTNDGAVLVWFASKGTTMNVGDVVTITARIKDHAIYRDCKETKVTHVKTM